MGLCRQHRDDHRGGIGAEEATAVLRERDPCPWHLPWPASVPQLVRELDKLPATGRTDRMAFGKQAAARVHDTPPAQPRLAGPQQRGPIARRAQAQLLVRHQLGGRGRIVHLQQIQVFRTDSGTLVGHGGRSLHRAWFVTRAISAGNERATAHPDRMRAKAPCAGVLVFQYQGGRAPEQHRALQRQRRRRPQGQLRRHHHRLELVGPPGLEPERLRQHDLSERDHSGLECRPVRPAVLERRQRDQGVQQHRLHHRRRRPARQPGARQPGLVLDYNNYWANGNATTLFVWNGGVPQYTEGGATTYTSFAAFRTGTGQEAHGSFVNPLLTTPGSMPTLTPTTLTSLSGYKLQSSSPVADSGVTLSSVGISPGPSDFYGDTVPVGAGFSMGAHDR